MTGVDTPEGPRFTTTADLEALEGRLINRLALLDGRLDHAVTHKDLLLSALAIAGLNVAVVAAFGAATLFALNQLAAQIAALR